MDQLGIGDLARQTGLNPSAIRYYERMGLLPEPARLNGRRRYDAGILKRLAIVRMAQEAGLTIEEIGTLLGGFPEGTPPGDRSRELTRRKLPEVDALIGRMLIVREVLEESLQCDCLTLDTCADHGWSTGPRGPLAGESRSGMKRPLRIIHKGLAVGNETAAIPRAAPRRVRAAPEPRALGRGGSWSPVQIRPRRPEPRCPYRVVRCARCRATPRQGHLADSHTRP